MKVYSEGGTHGPGPPGVNEYSAWSRAICGNRAEAPPALYSHGPLLVLEFHTESKPSNATGFVGTYRFIDRRKWVIVLFYLYENITVCFLTSDDKKECYKFDASVGLSVASWFLNE